MFAASSSTCSFNFSASRMADTRWSTTLSMQIWRNENRKGQDAGGFSPKKIDLRWNTYIFVWVYIYMFIYLCIYLFIYLFMYLCIIYLLLLIYLFIYLCVWYTILNSVYITFQHSIILYMYDILWYIMFDITKCPSKPVPTVPERPILWNTIVLLAIYVLSQVKSPRSSHSRTDD